MAVVHHVDVKLRDDMTEPEIKDAIQKLSKALVKALGLVYLLCRKTPLTPSMQALSVGCANVESAVNNWDGPPMIQQVQPVLQQQRPQ